MAEKGGLTLDALRNIEDTPENRQKYFEYPEEELIAVLNEAIKKNNEFGIARFLIGVLENKRNTNVQLKTALDDKKSQEAMAKQSEEEQEWEPTEINEEFVKANGEYVNLYRDQGKAVEWIDKYNKKQGINARTLKPQNIQIGYDKENNIKTLIARYGFILCAFKVTNEESGELEEIDLIQDKITSNDTIDEIYEEGDFWKIKVLHKRNADDILAEIRWYVVDKSFNEVPKLGEQNGHINFSLNVFGAYEQRRNSGNDEQNITVYNKNMEEIASFINDTETHHDITYCDSNICICYVYGKEFRGYKVFKGNEVIFEGTEKELEENLKGEDYMKAYSTYVQKKEEGLDKMKARMSLPPETGYQCELVYNNVAKTSISIINDAGNVIYELSDILVATTDKNRFIFYMRNNRIISIRNRFEESGILEISDNNGETIIINKKTGERLQGENKKCYKKGELILMRQDKNNGIAEIYDNNLKSLGTYNAREYFQSNYVDMGFIPVMKEVNGEKRYYIASTQKGKIITEFYNAKEGWGSCHPFYTYKKVEGYYDEGIEQPSKLLLICLVPGKDRKSKRLAQVEIY